MITDIENGIITLRFEKAYGYNVWRLQFYWPRVKITPNEKFIDIPLLEGRIASWTRNGYHYRGAGLRILGFGTAWDWQYKEGDK